MLCLVAQIAPKYGGRALCGVRLLRDLMVVALRHAEANYRISGYLLSMARQGYNFLNAIQIVLNSNAATMIEHPTQEATRPPTRERVVARRVPS